MQRRSISDYSLSRNSLGSPPVAESTNYGDEMNMKSRLGNSSVSVTVICYAMR